MRDKKNIEGILPLTEQQAGMLLYCARPGPDDLGFLQVEFELVGELDLDAWREAWRRAIKRHDALRMTVESPEGKKPMVLVWKEVELPWRHEDLGALDAAAQRERLDAYRQDDRGRGLELNQMPVMRVATFDLSAERHRVVWSCHHLLLDGWSSSIVLADCLAFHEAERNGTGGPPRLESTYREYRSYLKETDEGEALAHWRSELGKPLEPLHLVKGRKGLSHLAQKTVAMELSESDSTALRRLCNEERLTVGAVLRGVWATVLGAMCGRTDVVYGAVVSGRAADFPGVGQLAGFFSNTIPVRLKIPSGVPASSWLRELRDQQLRAQRHETVSLNRILAEGQFAATPFDSLLLIENLPSAGAADGGGLRMENYASSVTSVFPLTLTVVPEAKWKFSLILDPELVSEAWAGELLEGLGRLLKALCAEPEIPLSRLASELGFVEPPMQGTPDGEAVVHPASVHEGPRNRCELELVEVWQEILEVQGIGIHDDFFELGGRSIQAIRVFSEIERRFQKTLPAALLIQHPSIAKLSALLDGDAGVSLKSLVPITAAGKGPALFVVHAGGGHVFVYRDFAEHLGPRARVYGLQPVGLSGDEQPLDSVEEMAARYLQEMLVLQESGPYHLLGYCYGASVVFEIAQLLRARGQEVGGLILVDSAPPNGYRQRVGACPTLRKLRFAHHRRGGGLRGFFGMVAAQTRSRYRSLKHKYGRRLEKDAETARLAKIEDACRRAFLSYSPSVYPGQVLFLRGTDLDELYRHSIYWEEGIIEDWQRVVPELEVREMPCRHADFFDEPHVVSLAEIVAKHLDL